MLGMYSLVAILLVYLAPEIVRILATEEYYKGIYIMPPIAGGVYFIAVSNLYSDILVYLKKTKMVMVSSAIAAALNVVLNYIMINAYGYMAAAYTTLISYIIMALLLSIWANREFKKHIKEVDFVYDNKLILAISIMTLISSLFAISIYDYAIVRYAVAAGYFHCNGLVWHSLSERKQRYEKGQILKESCNSINGRFESITIWRIGKVGVISKIADRMARRNPIEYARKLGVKVGKECRFTGNPRWGSEPWLIQVENHVLLSAEVNFVTHDAGTFLFRDTEEYKDVFKFAPIVIHDNCFIGMRSTLLPGIEIGPNSVIAAGSVVTRSVPPGEVWGGYQLIS